MSTMNTTEALLFFCYSCSPVAYKSETKSQDDEHSTGQWSQNRKDSKPVRHRLKCVVVSQGVSGEPNLHCGQHNCDVDRRPG
ncbi:hypothetical protein BFJ70_g16743 [Fusarium oxysporum]|nr:hypothetical protein BFJ70_g16743 [Fusarium oxysporum]